MVEERQTRRALLATSTAVALGATGCAGNRTTSAQQTDSPQSTTLDRSTIEAETTGQDYSPDQPSFVLFMADDMGYMDPGFMGNEVAETPNIDAMAENGLVHNRFYAAAPVCSPTRGSVLTGRHPGRFGCFRHTQTIQPEEITIPETLSEAGYRTGHFGKWHLGPVEPASPVSPAHSGFDTFLSNGNYFEDDPFLVGPDGRHRYEGPGSVVIVDRAIQFIREAVEANDPFLAVIWYAAPHWPWKAPKQFREPYSQLESNPANYYGEITELDYATGRLRDELGMLGAREETLLWFTSDNGASGPGKNGLRGEKGALWEGGIRVPCVLEWPGTIDDGIDRSMPSWTSDMFPTLLGLADVSVPDRPLDGIDLWPMISGEQATRETPIPFWFPFSKGNLVEPFREAYMKASTAEKFEDRLQPDRYDLSKLPNPDPESEPPGWTLLIDGDFELHRKPTDDGNKKSILLDVTATEDPYSKNRIEDYPERAALMQSSIQEWQASVLSSLHGNDY